MAENTKIEWAHDSFNPWLGCERVHTGCKHCYAFEQHFKRFGLIGKRRKTAGTNWRKPLAWDRAAAEDGERCRVFPSLCDPFEDWKGPIMDHRGQQLMRSLHGCGSGDMYVKGCGYDRTEDRPVIMDDLRRDFFGLIDQTRNLDYLLLTKRAHNIRRMWTWPKGDDGEAQHSIDGRSVHYRKNVWLLYSASDQETLDAGMPHLLKCRDLVPVLGLSLEPLVGPVDLTQCFQCPRCFDNGKTWDGITDHDCEVCNGDSVERGNIDGGIDWVICGGESGPKARPCHVEWIDDIVQQCHAARVPCFVKQLGANPYTDHCTCGLNADGHWKGPAVCFNCDGRLYLADPKGGDPTEWPERLQIQQYPEVKR